MAFRSRRSYRRPLRRTTRRVGSSRPYRFRSRRSYGPLRRTRFRRPGFARRRILNVSSKKKKDTLLTAIRSPGDTIVDSVVQFNVPALGFTPHVFIFSPSMRYKRSFDSDLPTDMSREDDEIYYVGFGERLRFATSDSSDWRWRRIVFSAYIHQVWEFPTTGAPIQAEYPISNGEADTGGYRRVFQRVEPASSATDPVKATFIRGQLYYHLFRGTQNSDWSNPMTAPINTQKVHVYHDRLTRIASNSDAGAQLITKRWHPIRKNMIFDDQEFGKENLSLPYAGSSRRGIGDVYVVDMFQCVNDSEGVDLSIGTDATTYWHER